jgi:DNA-directed RNA polymerase II subunit RPB1
MASSGQNKCANIVGIQFSILSPEEIRRGSVVEVKNRETYKDNKPIIDGLFDPRMGVLDPGYVCPTDGLDYIQSPGYFGHLELVRPVFYPQYIPTILKTLNSVCLKCGKLLVNKDKYRHTLAMLPEQRGKIINTAASKVKQCGAETDDGCGYDKPIKIVKDNSTMVIHGEWSTTDNLGENGKKNVTKVILTISPEVVLQLFKRISDEDVVFLGMHPLWSRPDWMVCQTLLIPPPSMRPSVKHDANQHSEDDLTHILINIIKRNKLVQDRIDNNASQSSIDEGVAHIQYLLMCFVDNRIQNGGLTQRSGRVLKSIKDRLNGKTGRMRGNLMAKRVDYSARSVITADPNISIQELGIPMRIAKNLTKPVVVNKRNRSFLSQLVYNGPDVHPGAKILERKDGKLITLKYANRDLLSIEIGDRVHRHMMNGDPILFNRQPSLHRMSMMCHLARVMEKGDTFRMNVANTKPYNADFDKHSVENMGR